MTMELTWLGQAGFLIEDGRARIAIDPFLSDYPDRLRQSPVPADRFPPVDAIFVSHEHRDHLDAAALRTVLDSQPDARLVLPEPLIALAETGGLRQEQLFPTRPGRWYTVGTVRFQPVPAMHGVGMADAYAFSPPGEPGTRFQGYVVSMDQSVLYHAGDSLAYDGQTELLAALNVELALLPINGRDVHRESLDIVGNMDHREAADLAARAGCRAIMPMHYGMFALNTADPADLQAYVREQALHLEVLLPQHGAPIEWPMNGRPG